MSDFTDEPPSLTERFDALESLLGKIAETQALHGKALGLLLAKQIPGAQLAVPPALLEALGVVQRRVLPASELGS